MAVEPAGDGRHQRCENGAAAHPDQNTIEQLKLLDRGRSACQHQAEAQDRTAGQQHDARTEPVHHHAPAETGDAHRDEVECHRQRNRGARPAGRSRHRLQEHRQRKDRADRDAAHEPASGNDDPAIVRIHGIFLRTTAPAGGVVDDSVFGQSFTVVLQRRPARDRPRRASASDHRSSARCCEMIPMAFRPRASRSPWTPTENRRS